MTEKHYPYCGGSFDRIIFDKDGSVWVPETENAKLRELVRDMWTSYCWANTGDEVFLTHEQDVEIRDRIRELVMEP